MLSLLLRTDKNYVSGIYSSITIYTINLLVYFVFPYWIFKIFTGYRPILDAMKSFAQDSPDLKKTTTVDIEVNIRIEKSEEYYFYEGVY